MQVFIALCLLCLGSAFAVRSQWNQLARADLEAQIPIRFALTQRNLDVLESTLLDISDTTSPNYGKWWTAEAVTELVAPPKAVSQKVADFLKSYGATTVEDHRDMIKVTAPVRLVEQMLQTSLYYFQHNTKTSKVIIRAVGSYQIPSAIREHVDFVAGLFEFPSIRNKASRIAKDSDLADGFVVPITINSLYNIPSTFAVNANSSICLVEFQDDQSYDKDDLKDFSKQNAIPDIVVSHIVGPFSGDSPDAESTLDVQYGSAIAQNSTVWFWTVADWMYDFATDLIATKNPPLVISMSWGWPEPNQCEVGNCTGDETSEQYVNRTNVEFQKIGTIGISLFAASGDQGAPGDGNPDCSGTGSAALSTIFPGASPWVVSVGATMLAANGSKMADAATPPICSQFQCATTTTEAVCTYPDALITTGGGFSDYSVRPTFQNAAQNAYLNSGVTLPPAASFTPANRGFPDVSGLGHNYLIELGGQFLQVDGTSCSSPVLGAMFALLNSYRLDQGKSSLGYVVPLLYQAFAANPAAFTDITSGDNKCTENCCAKIGYLATKGWDPVTGLGTPKFDQLLAFVKTLP